MDIWNIKIDDTIMKPINKWENTKHSTVFKFIIRTNNWSEMGYFIICILFVRGLKMRWYDFYTVNTMKITKKQLFLQSYWLVIKKNQNE